MLIKLNFVLGQRTINDRYYNPDQFVEQIKSLIERDGKIPVGPDSKCIDTKTGAIPDDKIVGFATSYQVTENGEMLFDVVDMSPPTEAYLKQNPGVVELSSFAFGKLGKNGIVEDFTLTSLFMTMDKLNVEGQ